LTFFKTSVGNIAAGYLSIPWHPEGGATKDPNCFLLSVKYKRKLTHDKTQFATFFGPNQGPRFGWSSLSVEDRELMNSEGNCVGLTGGVLGDCFKTPLDENGKSILTGMGKHFQIIGLETF